MELEGIGKVNRSEDMTTNKRRAQRLVGKSTWFSKPKTNQIKSQQNPTLINRTKHRSKVPDKIESVLFIPYTPQSILKETITRD